MSERPILFSAPMVRAVLAGTKTQTRRVSGLDVINAAPDRYDYLGIVSGPGEPHHAFHDKVTNAQTLVRCRSGQPGDRLWVRETFYCDHCFYPEGTPPSCYWDGPNPRAAHTPEQLAKERSDMLEAMYYRADGEPEFEAPEGPTPWRPSIHMPRWASRITLEVTGVRVERLQDISEADALAEGCTGKLHEQAPALDQARQEFSDLWESINGPGSWDANPWVWVVEFRRLL